MEASSSTNVLALFGIIVQSAIILAVIVGLFYLSRKNKAFRIGLIIVLGLLLVTAAFIVVTFKEMGKGWAL